MNTNMMLLAATPLVVWLGVFFYLLSIDRKLASLEAASKALEQDDL